MPTFLPYARQQLDDDDIAAVTAVLRGDYLTTGPATHAFEDKLAEITGAPFAVSCSSGTAALHLAALALGLKAGEAAVVPAITFLATANAVLYTGADVVFADVDPDSGLMGPKELTRALDTATGDVKAVFPVLLGGQGPDMAAIADIARERGLAVVEDASHAIGSTYARPDGNAAVGSCRDSDMTVFSFHPIKTVTMGEGGAVTTKDPALAGRLENLRNHGMTRTPAAFVNDAMAFDKEGAANPWYYEMQSLGFNYRASDLHCALGLSQLSKLGKFIERRRHLAARYDELLEPLAPTLRPIARTPGGRPAWHIYQVLIDFDAAGVTRGQLMRTLHDRGIGTQVHYIPVPHQPFYRDRYGMAEVPGADSFYARAISLPLFPGMSDGDVARVVSALSQRLDTNGAH